MKPRGASLLAIIMVTIGAAAWLTPSIGAANPATGHQSSSRSLKDDCVAEGLKMPKVFRAGMVGRGNPRRQAVSMNVWARPLRSECRTVYDRTMTGRIFMKNVANRHPVKLVDQKIRVIEGGKVPDGVYRTPAGHIGWPKRLLYKCTPGPRKTKVYGVIDRTLVEKSTGKQVARKINRVPFQIKRPGPC